MVWLGACEGSAQLGALHDEVARRLAGCGFAAEERPFHPHVTIGRAKRPKGADRAGVRVALETVSLDVPRWLVERVVLYESRLGPRGSTYHVLTGGSLGSPVR